MTLHDALWLYGGVLAFYLYDASVLLYHNEVLLSAGRRWRVVPIAGIQLRGRYVVLPAPWHVGQLWLRLAWSATATVGSAPLRWHRLQLAARLLAPGMWVLLAWYALVLPYVLFVQGDVHALLTWLASAYLLTGLQLWQVWRLRRLLGLTWRSWCAVASDALLCPPFALNLLRKLGLRQRVQVDLPAAARQALRPAERMQLGQLLQQRIATQLAFVDENSEQAVALRAYLQRFDLPQGEELA